MQLLESLRLALHGKDTKVPVYNDGKYKKNTFPENKDTIQCYVEETDSRDLHFFKLILQLTDIISGFLDRISVNRLLLIARTLLIARLLSDTGEAALQIQPRFKI